MTIGGMDMGRDELYFDNRSTGRGDHLEQIQRRGGSVHLGFESKVMTGARSHYNA